MKIWHWLLIGGGAAYLLLRKKSVASPPPTTSPLVSTVADAVVSGAGGAIGYQPSVEPTELLDVLRMKQYGSTGRVFQVFTRNDGVVAIVVLDAITGSSITTRTALSMAEALAWARTLPAGSSTASWKWAG